MSIVSRLLNSQVFLLLAGVLILSLLGVGVLVEKDILPSTIDPLFAFMILWIALLAGLKLLFRSFSTPFYSFFPLMTLTVWIGLDSLTFGKYLGGASLKPQVFIVLFATANSLVYIIRDFKYLWKFRLFQCFLFFFLLNLFDYFFYSTDFKLAGASAGYPVAANISPEADTDTKTIILLSSMGCFISIVCGLQVFRRMKETWTKEKLHQALAHVIVAVVLAIATYTFMVAVNLFGIPMPGHPVLSVFHFFILATSTLWMSEKFPQHKVLGIPFVWICLLTLPLNLLSLVVALNKTGLVGFLSTAAVFILLNQMFIYKTPYVEKILNFLKSPQNILIIGFAMAGSIMLLYAVDFFTLVADKISYYEKGFSSLSTLQVRTGNWFYFIHEWADTLNIQKFFFGFGAGEARKTIFYISAMRNSVNENNLVQTVHNNYMDSAYDFGLCTLLYHLPALLINIQNIKTILDPNAPRSLKIFSLMSLTFIMYISIYALMDGVRVQVSIVYYATLALVEGLRAQYSSFMTKHSKTGTKPTA